MAIRLTTTKETADGVKVLVYGETGVGKTKLIETAPNPVIISAEKGLLTLKRVNIPVIEISSFEDLEQAYEFVTTDQRAKGFKTICLDSISDIAQTVLDEEKEKAGKDPRKAYGNYADKMIPMIKKFRDISGKNVYFTSQMKRTEDEFSGIDRFGPGMPGKQLGQLLPYLFDFCFALRIGQDGETGETFRYLQTQPDIQYIAKERGSSLLEIEAPDLTEIFKKALSYDVVDKHIHNKPTDVAEVTEEVVEEAKPEVVGSFDLEFKEEVVEADPIVEAAEESLVE